MTDQEEKKGTKKEIYTKKERKKERKKKRKNIFHPLLRRIIIVTRLKQ